MTVHNIDRFHKCTQAQIYTELSPETDGVFAYATDTGTLYVSHNGGWVIANLGTGVKNYQYAGVDINPLVHVDATNTDSLRTIDETAAGNMDTIHQWKDASGRNDLVSELTRTPVLSADAINGKPGVYFGTTLQTEGSFYPSNTNAEISCQLTSRPKPNRTLKHVTCFAVCYIPSQKPWNDNTVYPSSTHVHNKLALPIVTTSGAYRITSNSAWYLGYKRYNHTLDRYYVGSGGTYNYRSNYVDLGPTTQSDEVRMSPKILWATATYNDPDHHGLVYSGINGAGRTTLRTSSTVKHTPPDMTCVSVGMDNHNIVGEVLLCDQAMTGSELNKIGSYLSNKWNITWTNLPEFS